ncbi:Trm112 family protein [Pseudodesulfovibrio sp.]|uniref:Trm112 family protein n=1 Tax=unclassified Pseudodesulfovibrio TaxID=2661612 RepID=UPI003B00481C
MALKKELVEILACPKCKGSVAETPAGDGLACSACKVVYPVRDDIPIMLVDQAVPDKDWTGSK